MRFLFKNLANTAVLIKSRQCVLAKCTLFEIQKYEFFISKVNLFKYKYKLMLHQKSARVYLWFILTSKNPEPYYRKCQIYMCLIKYIKYIGRLLKPGTQTLKKNWVFLTKVGLPIRNKTFSMCLIQNTHLLHFCKRQLMHPEGLTAFFFFFCSPLLQFFA